MRSFLLKVFGNTFTSCRRHRALVITLIVGIVVTMILGVVSGIRLNHSMFPQDFSNVSYIKFLKGSTGFAGFLFTTIFTITIFIFIILLSGYKKWLFGIGILFFMYFVYAQTVTIVSITMDFGFFNTLILVVYLIIISIIYFFLLTLIVVQCADCCNCPSYFSVALKSITPTIIALVLIILFNVIFLMTLKNFVIILVYKG